MSAASGSRDASDVPHLLIVQLGPVQDFIAQARRTRDLWFGSHLLSELSRAGAKAAAAYGELIFPALKADDVELEPCDKLEREPGKAPVSIANKIVVELHGSQAPRSAARAIREAVTARWRVIATAVRDEHRADLAEGIDQVWDEQIGSLIEYAAAWAPIGTDYAEARRQVEAALGGRRRLRDFAPMTHRRTGEPASSLDGGRVSVLPPRGSRKASRAERRLLLGEGENLDAVGVVKRRGGEPEQFVSVLNVAVAPWLRRAAASQEASSALDALRVACRELKVEDARAKGVTRRLDKSSRQDLPGAKLFPYNASVLFASRLPGVFEELGLDKEDAAQRARAWDVEHLRPLLRAAGEPPGYVACLVADGDRMGLAIEGLRSADAHRALARRLGAYPATARHIVEQDHDGIAVYAGGDDVFAFVPVCRAVACAEALRVAFAREVGEALEAAYRVDQAAGHAPPAEAAHPATPTLSVGVGIGHILDTLGHLRVLGARAEKAAKQTRNALAVLIDRRSGGEHLWTSSWGDEPAARLADDVRLLTSGADRPARLPMSKVHELARLLRSFSMLTTSTVRAAHRAAPLRPEVGPLVLRGEVTRILARTHRGATHAPATATTPEERDESVAAGLGLTPKDVGLALSGEDFGVLHQALAAWVARLQIAQVLAASAPNCDAASTSDLDLPVQDSPSEEATP